MKLFTIADIRSWEPCYDPSRHLPEDWSGTALDMLKHPTIPDTDKTWLMRQPGVMTDKGLRLFAIDCARRAQTYPKNYTPDPRTLAAIDTAERFVEGRATAEELKAAADGAYIAAYAAYTARAAAYAADGYAARAAAYTARAAAYAASYAAASYASYAADAAANAYAAERSKQVEYLIALAEKPGMFVGDE